MAVLLSPVGGVAAQFFTNAGVPLSGGKIYTYAAGTSTPQATYTTGAGNIQHSNPIVLDAAGRVPTGEIWLTDGLSYKFVLKDANDVLIATYDNIVGINSNFVNFVNQQEIQTATAGQTVFTLTTMEYQPGTGNLSVFVDGVNQYGPGAQYAYTETSSTVITFVSGLHVGASVKFTTTEIQNSGVADASQITYTYPDANAVQESVETRLAQYASVMDFGAIGDGVTDDTTAIQNALDSGAKAIYFGDSSKSYKIDGTLTVQTKTILFADGATVTQTADHTILFDVSDTDDVSIYGFNMVGVGTDFIDSDTTNPAIAINAQVVTNLKVFNNKFTNFSYTTVKAENASDFQFLNNIVVGPGTPILTPITDGRNYGLLVQLSDRAIVDDNIISQCAQGLRIEIVSDIIMSNNIIFDIVGQHGIYSGAQVINQNISNNVIYNTELIGIKCQASESYTNVINVVISGNNISNTGDQGILLCCGDGTRKTVRVYDATVTGNTIRDAGATGINVQNVTNGVVTGNSIFDSGDNGINLSACDYITVDSNNIIGAGNNGITDQYGNTNLVVSDNRLHNCGANNLVGYEYGIFFSATDSCIIDNNCVTDSQANMKYGIYIAANQTGFEITNNTVDQSTDYAIRLANNTDALKAYFGNSFTGTLGVGYNSPALQSVASASTISVPTNVSVVKITGTTGISTINATGQTGQVVTLIFADAVTVSDGTSLRLAGSFTSSADDTLTLACDGNYWYEISRSVN